MISSVPSHTILGSGARGSAGTGRPSLRVPPDGSPTHTYKITDPGARVLSELRHDGYEWLYALSGRLRLRLGEQDLVFIRGEAAQCDTRIPHAQTAGGGKPAQVLSIFNDVGACMQTHIAATESWRSTGYPRWICGRASVRRVSAGAKPRPCQNGAESALSTT